MHHSSCHSRRRQTPDARRQTPHDHCVPSFCHRVCTRTSPIPQRPALDGVSSNWELHRLLSGQLKMDASYQNLTSSPEEKDSGGRKRFKSSRLRHALTAYVQFPLLLLKDILLLSLAILGLISLWHSSVVSPPTTGLLDSTVATNSRPSCDCGASVAEAVSLGCKYDSLAAAWLPEHCRDEELTAKFEKAGDGSNGEWTYWRDVNRTQILPLEELRTLGDDPSFTFYTTAAWHHVHCLFYWRKQFRARYTGVTVEPRFDDERHIIHCTAVVLDRTDDERGSASSIVFNSDFI